jgi:hypothetical protein
MNGNDAQTSVNSETMCKQVPERSMTCFHLSHVYRGFGMARAGMPSSEYGELVQCAGCFKQAFKSKLNNAYKNNPNDLADTIRFDQCPHVHVDTVPQPFCPKCLNGITKALTSEARRSKQVRLVLQRWKERFKADDSSILECLIENSLREEAFIPELPDGW